MSDPDFDGDDDYDGEAKTCQECGFVGEFLEEELPEHLWGPMGQVIGQCPECGSYEDLLG